MLPLFSSVEYGEFIERPNRFVVHLRLIEEGGRRIKAFLPNPGRLSELLFPGVKLYLERSDNKDRKLPYTVVGVEGGGLYRDSGKGGKGAHRYPVMLHTHKTNDIAEHLLREGLIPEFRGADVVRREVTRGHSRYDLLLSRGGSDLLVEVKSCTLFSKNLAMFPDAVTERGKKHILGLKEIADGTATECGVLFIVNNGGIGSFLPDYHTDPDFAMALYEVRNSISIVPVGVDYTETLDLVEKVHPVKILWEVFEREMVDTGGDRGAYLLVLSLNRRRRVEVGALGSKVFEKGYYIYVGSALSNLSKRIGRHRRRGKGKALKWHIDYLREVAALHGVLPIRSSGDLECEIAGDLEGLHDVEGGDGGGVEVVKGFGASDCRCPGHLFYSEKDPMDSTDFHRLIQYYRMERLLEGR